MRGRLLAAVAFVAALAAVVVAAAPAGAFAPAPIVYGPGSQVIADTLPEWAALGGAPLTGTLGAAAPLLLLAGDSAPVKLVVQSCVDNIRAHSGFPQFDAAGGVAGGQGPDTCSPVQLLTYGVYTAATIVLEPWEKRWCVALYTVGSGSASSWTGFDSAFGVGVQAMVDTACPSAWRPWILNPTTTPPSQPTTTTIPPVQAPGTIPTPVTSPLIIAPGAASVGAGGTADAGHCNVNVYVTPWPAGGAGYYTWGFSYACNVPASAVWGASPKSSGIYLDYKPSGGSWSQFASDAFTATACGSGMGAPLQGSCQNMAIDNTALHINGAGETGFTNNSSLVTSLTGSSTAFCLQTLQAYNSGVGGSCPVTADTLTRYTTGPMVIPGYPGKYYTGGSPGSQTAPSTYTTTPGVAPGSVTTKGTGACTGVVDCTLDLGDRLVTQLSNVGASIVNGVVTGIDAGLGQLSTALTWIGNVTNTWLADIDAVLRTISSQTTWVGNVVAAGSNAVVSAVNATTAAVGTVVSSVDAAAVSVGAAVSSAGSSVVTAVQASAAAVVAAVQAIPAVVTVPATAIASAIATQLQTLLIPSGTGIETTLTQLQTAASNTFIGTAVTTATSLANGIVAGANSGIGGSCGPSIGFDGFSVSGQSVPGFRVYLPSGAGCTGNGAGGARTAQDISAYDLLGYRDIVRGIAAFAMVYSFMWSLIKVAPWSKRSGEVAPVGSGPIPLGYEGSFSEYANGGMDEARAYMRGAHR